MNHYIIAIDPDTEKSGIAVINKTERTIDVHSLAFPYCLDFMQRFMCIHNLEDKVQIFVEGGWLNKKSNFHSFSKNKNVDDKKENNMQFIGERIAGKVGANHETGKKLCEMFDYYNIPYQVVKPLRKIWKDKKISHEEINGILQRNKFETFTRTNQDVRDALIIGLYHSNIL